jgi:hypothetical protein
MTMRPKVGWLLGLAVLAGDDDVYTLLTSSRMSLHLRNTLWFEDLVAAARELAVAAHMGFNDLRLECRFVVYRDRLELLPPEGCTLENAIRPILSRFPSELVVST